MELNFNIQKLHLKRTFTIFRRSSDFRKTVRFFSTHQGITGCEEVAPNPRYGEDVPMVTQVFEKLQYHSFTSEPSRPEVFLEEATQLTDFVFSSQAAIDLAVYNWSGKKMGQPLYKTWNIPADKPLRVSMSISIDSMEKRAERALEAAEFKVLKVKPSSPRDRKRNQSKTGNLTDTEAQNG